MSFLTCDYCHQHSNILRTMNDIDDFLYCPNCLAQLVERISIPQASQLVHRWGNRLLKLGGHIEKKSKHLFFLYADHLHTRIEEDIQKDFEMFRYGKQVTPESDLILGHSHSFTIYIHKTDFVIVEVRHTKNQCMTVDGPGEYLQNMIVTFSVYHDEESFFSHLQ